MAQKLAPNTEVLKQLVTTVEKEHQTTCDVVEQLLEVDKDRLYVQAGYSSIYAYCTVELGYSEPAALRRIRAARYMKMFPKLRELLRERKLNLTTLNMLTKHVYDPNFRQLLEEAAGKSKSAVLDLIARNNPKDSDRVRDCIRPVYIKSNNIDQQPLPLGSGENLPFSFREDAPVEKRIKVSFTAAPEFETKVRRIQEILSNKYGPGTPLENVFGEALDLYLKHHCPMERAMRRANRKARKQNLDKPTKEILDSVAPLSRHIPAQLRDEVFMKEGCQCNYVSPNGVRCQAREQLEIDHIVPFSAGGKTILGNLRLRCKQHNLLAAEQFYGKGKIEQFRRQA